jgi:hypothetical protein
MWSLGGRPIIKICCYSAWHKGEEPETTALDNYHIMENKGT